MQYTALRDGRTRQLSVPALGTLLCMIVHTVRTMRATWLHDDALQVTWWFVSVEMRDAPSSFPGTRYPVLTFLFICTQAIIVRRMEQARCTILRMPFSIFSCCCALKKSIQPYKIDEFVSKRHSSVDATFSAPTTFPASQNTSYDRGM